MPVQVTIDLLLPFDLDQCDGCEIIQETVDEMAESRSLSISRKGFEPSQFS